MKFNYTPQFEAVFEHVLLAEGKNFTNIKEDKGGPTKFGITQRTLSHYRGYTVSFQEVRDMKIEEAKEIYWQEFWDKMSLDVVPYFLIQTLLFDQGVNRGSTTAAREFQEVLAKVSGHPLKLDGKIGQKTVAAIKAVDQITLAQEYCFDMQDDYIAIMKKDPTQVKFIAGWINRTQRLMAKVFDYLRPKKG